jgi:two-component system sensor kinase FixL
MGPGGHGKGGEHQDESASHDATDYHQCLRQSARGQGLCHSIGPDAAPSARLPRIAPRGASPDRIMTSPVTFVWSAIASACLSLAAIQALIGLRQRRPANLLFAGNGLSAAAIAVFELALMHAATPAEYGAILRWIQLPIFTLVATLVLFVRAYFRSGSRWLAAATIAARGAALMVDFLRRPNLNFVEISGLRRVPFLGEPVSVAEGVVSRWTRLGEASSLLLLAFLVSAAVGAWRRGKRRLATVVGGSMILFVLYAAGHNALIHAGAVNLPYLIGLPYLVVVAAMTYELTSDILRASELSRALRKSEDALLESERKVGVAAEAAKLGFWTWDVGADAIWMTPTGRALRGIAPEGTIDIQRFLAAVHPDERAGIRQAIEGAARNGGSFELEYRVRRPDGQIGWISLRGSGEPRGDGGTARVRGVSIDITTRKLAELEAERRQRELAHLSRATVLGELSGSLAHEINQPLTAILSNAQAAQRFLTRGSTNLAEVREILADIVEEGKHASEVIRRLRMFLKREESRPEMLALPVLVDDVARLLRGELVRRGISFSPSLPVDLPRVLGDRVQIEQVLLNLMTNACDAVEQAGSEDRALFLSAVVEEGARVRVSVRDRGCGIARSDLQRIFDPFVTTKETGMGLGLSVCRTIVTAHGGRLWAVNNEDRGATFHFTLPVFEETRR